MFKHCRNLISFVFILSIIFLLAPYYGAAQQDSAQLKTGFLSNVSIGLKGYYGSFITPKAKVEYIRDSYASLGEITLQFQTDGSRDWHITHNYPRWGIGYIYGNSGSREYIGNASILHAFLDLPLLSTKKYTGSFLLGTGVGWVSKPYDAVTNFKNTILGTKLNAFVNLGLNNEFSVSKRLFINASLGFMHLSNGGTTLPNLGLNTPILGAGLRYALNVPIRMKRPVADTFPKKTTFNIYTAIGFKQSPWIGSSHYLINTAQVELMRRFAYNHAAGGGLIFFYKRTMRIAPEDSISGKIDKFQAGIFGSYEHFFGKLSVPLQAGFYLYNSGKSPAFFQQFGFRVQCTKRLSATLFLKTDMGKADFIHTGIGYALK